MPVILDPNTGERKHMCSETGDVIDFEQWKLRREEEKKIEQARASVRDTWLESHTRETQAFIEERRAYALGDPGDEIGC